MPFTSSLCSSQLSVSLNIWRLISDPLAFSDTGDPTLYTFVFTRRSATNVLATVAAAAFLFDIGKRAFSNAVAWAAINGRRKLRELIRQRALVQSEMARTERKRVMATRELRQVKNDFRRATRNIKGFEALPFAIHSPLTLSSTKFDSNLEAGLMDLKRRFHAERSKILQESCGKLDAEIQKTEETIEFLLS
ncbi:hypothetical protein GYMLUDRAFT_58017 [Collybiopsis luxurians FD-317 M1]|uniref:Uncharacterized protein n=1 Tax=Collybiopsis luxurians FD-317 M1 TaxID=944289 RepID=A0A0D0CTH5_9AGAR|nr:hypothetical protein GYMLUDRAFT_58017 [Collybiopsis luxurians FD-317 M1]